jgi:hypothetical protein
MTSEKDDGLASWADYRRHVVSELERLNDIIEKFDSKLDKVVDDHRRDLNQRDTAIWKELSEQKIAIAMLQVKSSVWGGLSGALASLLVAVAAVLVGLIKH